MIELEKAIREENIEKVKEILSWEPNLVDEVDGEGIPMAFLAAKTGNLDLVKYVVEYTRASMNIVDTQNKNILHYGAMSGNPTLCKYLVERVGMSPVSGDKDLVTPYELSRILGFSNLEDYFQEAVGTSLEGMYKNPIRSGMFPDPSILRVGEDYYMVNSSFIYFPCIPISHSRDLVHWRIVGYAITNPEWSMLGALEGGRGYWAPDISYDNGTFYITATYRLNDDGCVYRKQMVVTSDKAQGPYGKPVFLEEDGIDPSIFHEDGRHYMLLNRGARIFEISEGGRSIIGEPKLIYYGDFKRAPEGPHLLKKDGYYYLFLAEGGTGPGHRITVARSKEIMGIYEPCPYNPIMRQELEGEGLQRCGHGKPVSTPNGDWHMVYLCGRTMEGQYTILGRETALDPITWTGEGWPIVNQKKGPSVLQKNPLPSIFVESKESLIPLSKDWVFPREPEEGAVSYEGDYLLLKGSRGKLEEVDARNILLRRQTFFACECAVTLEIPKLLPKQELGITGYYDENSWICLSLFQEEGNYYLRVKEHIDDKNICSERVLISLKEGEELTLGMCVDYLKRTFYAQIGEKKQEIASYDNIYYLSDEGVSKGKRFTGAMVGMYVYRGESELYGKFRDFTYQDHKMEMK